MPRYEKCPAVIGSLADRIIHQYTEHEPLIQGMVKIDFLFAFSAVDDDGEPIDEPITVNGYKAYGWTRILDGKQRAKGNGDAEIILDGEYWKTLTDEQQTALLDHEIFHLDVRMKDGLVLLDDQDRPRLRLRKHDLQFGWFNTISQRHGEHSQERMQAKVLHDEYGQLYWPDLMTI